MAVLPIPGEQRPRHAVAIAISFAEALNRHRALTDQESRDLSLLLKGATSRSPLRRWTAAQDVQLITLLGEGLTAAEIGTRMNRSTDAVHTRLKRLKMREQR